MSLTGRCTIDSKALTTECNDKLTGFATKTVTLADQTRVALFVARSFRIETSTTVETKGAFPIVFAALDTIAVLGSIRVVPGTAGGARTTMSYERGAGPGGGTAASESGLSGGGASFCGIGGKAASSGAPLSEPAAAYGTPELIPLVGGSAGGVGYFTNASPHGGGALQLIAGTSVVVAASGAISAGGAGGDRGSSGGHEGAGGGASGGAILIEPPSVIVAGTLAANGGGGGGSAGAVAAGENGAADLLGVHHRPERRRRRRGSHSYQYEHRRRDHLGRDLARADHPVRDAGGIEALIDTLLSRDDGLPTAKPVVVATAPSKPAAEAGVDAATAVGPLCQQLAQCCKDLGDAGYDTTMCKSVLSTNNEDACYSKHDSYKQSGDCT